MSIQLALMECMLLYVSEKTFDLYLLLYLLTNILRHLHSVEMRLKPSSKWYCHKTHSSGVKYELATAVRRSAVVSLRGPYPASTSDITIFRGGTVEEGEDNWDKDSLYFKLKSLGVKAVGDSGYEGEPDVVLTSKEGQSKELREFIARVKNREESLHTRLKSWNILSNRFRHGHGDDKRMELHGNVTAAIVVITQYDFENGHPLFEVR